MQSFKNKNVLITGAASGIGRSLSNEFAKEGAQLILCDLDAESLESHARELRENNIDVSSYFADVSNYDSMKEFSDKVLKDHNHIDVLINNAGVNLMDRFIDGDLKDFKWVMDINFWGTVYGVNLFLESLLSRDQAHIVNISSILGLMSLPGQAAYNSSKAAIKGFTEALKMELTHTSVNVTCIHPGGVKTNIAIKAKTGTTISKDTKEKLISDFDKLSYTTSKSAAQQIVKGIKSNKRRIMVGIDAKIADLLVRIFPNNYEKIMGLEKRYKRYKNSK